jgi:hypothetical protein
MKTNQSNLARWWTVAAFAVAMAWVESAVVYYLRTLVDRLEPYQPDPLPLIGTLGPVELARELATLIMHFTVGVLAGRSWRARFGYMAICFGVWDTSYYLFLKVMCGWPHSLLDWDILFLLPLPWWGPVLAPMLIALLLIAWGTLVSRFGGISSATIPNWTIPALCALGIALALYVFMADAIRVAAGGAPVLCEMLPTRFNWPLFCVALVLVAAPLISLGRQAFERPMPAHVQ